MQQSHGLVAIAKLVVSPTYNVILLLVLLIVLVLVLLVLVTLHYTTLH